MKNHLGRRRFLAGSSAASLGLLATGVWTGSSRAAEVGLKTTLRKASIMGLPDEKGLLRLKEAGFEGIECTKWNASPEEADKAGALAERVGMRIHSVMRAWTQFNDSKAAPGHIESVKTALQTAQRLGADAVLLVPCRIGGMSMPTPWEFNIEFDEKTGHLTRVVEGDNAKYQAYIDAHNGATDASRAAVAKLIPAAESTKVVIALENVWNHLWVKPDLFKHFIDSFHSPWVRAYFDIGNHVKYAAPENWIRTLGKRIVKCHVKDFKLNDDGRGGRFVGIRDGSVNWPEVRKALDEVGYSGWVTIEGGGLPPEEASRRLDMILAGA